MKTVFVKAVFDIDCKWEDPLPSYRVFVKDELFVERTWIGNEFYFEEMLQIQAPPGQYHVRLEPVHLTPEKNYIITHRIEYGSERWVNKSIDPKAPRLRLVRPEKKIFDLVKFQTSNHRVEHGPARWIDDHCLEILA